MWGSVFSFSLVFQSPVQETRTNPAFRNALSDIRKPSGNANTFYQEGHDQKASGLKDKVLWVRVSVRFKSEVDEKD